MDSSTDENNQGMECDKCGMLFLNSNSLEIHKEKFCGGFENADNIETQIDNKGIKSPPINSKYIQSQKLNYPESPPIQSKHIQNNQKSNNDSDNNLDVEPLTPRKITNTHHFETQNDNLIISDLSKNDSNTPTKAQNAINQLQDYKNKKAKEQAIKDMEDVVVREKIKDKKLSTPLNINTTPLDSEYFNVKSSYAPKNDAYVNIFRSYSDFRKREQDVLQEVYNIDPEFIKYKNGNNKKQNFELFEKKFSIKEENQDYISNDFLSLFENDLYDFDFNYLDSVTFKTPPLTTNAIKQTKMSDFSPQNLKRIQEKTLQLEKERRELQIQLEGIRNDTSFPMPVQSNQSMNRMLAELREQQRINEAALTLLKKRLGTENQSRQATNAYGSVRSSNSNRSIPYSSKSIPPISYNNDKMTNLLGVNFDNSLSSDEIRMMRLNYLHNGGHDQNVLHKFTEMEYEARFKDTSRLKPSNQIDPNTVSLEAQIRKVDLDNKRLQAELEQLQDRYNNGNNSINYETPKKRSESNSLPPIHHTPLPQNTSRIKYVPVHEIMPNLVSQSRNTNYNPINNNINNNNNNYNEEAPYPTLNTTRLAKLKDLPPVPYDPVGGFLIFIDFILNIDSAFGCARVITCLHHPKSGLGEPSVLPIVNCESYVETGSKYSVALISTKQPVPRCPPQQALTILIELQMAYKDNNETKLKSCAWTKIPLFDSKNRLLSGRWRSQFRNLPIKSDAQFGTLNNIPEFGSTELFYRLVNLRDSDEQTNAPISPSYANQYNPTIQF